MANNLKYQPAVNQVELNFWNPQPEVLQCSKENGFLLEVYSPLGNDKQIGKSLFMIILLKSMTPSRIAENLADEKVQTFVRQYHSIRPVFELPQEDFERFETAAALHPLQRVVNLSTGWKLPFDVFDGQ
ncbi:hypothetical protein EV424DRAFT_1582184 [Suillus variegatus]|nr:hypothetical protein EV424DRAFT_1582184 [Suillus variegatus]